MNIEEAQYRLKDAIKLADKDEFDTAIKIFDEILSIKELSAESAAQVYVQRGRCFWELKQWEKAAEDFSKAKDLVPSNPDCRWTLCLILLQLQRFDEAWDLLEARWESKKFDSPRLKSPRPRWTKTSGHQNVLVWSEQGIGDQVLYLSMLHSVKRLCEKITVMIDARLSPILKRSFPEINFVSQMERIKGIDAHVPLASVCAEFVRSLGDIEHHAARKYLRPDMDRAKELRQKLAGGKRLIGLSWHSGAPRIGNHKSVTLPELMPLFKLPDTEFVSLQYGDCYEDMYELEKQHGVRVKIVPAIDNKDDIDGLCALISACDSVVTVSNATGHFAGALGVPTYLLNSNKLWYWSNEKEGHSVWYPSVKLYPRDNVIAPWTPQITKLVEDLK